MTDSNMLVELIKQAKQNMKGKEFSCQLEREFFIADYLLANGVTVLHFKVGNKVYFHQFDNDCKKVVVVGEIIKTSKNASECVVALKDGRNLEFKVDFLGKTVFLTKEEAEEKLKELG